MKTLHIVEPGGEGGVYQHVLGAAEHGTYSEWDRIVLHTSMDAEISPAIPGLEYHKCMRWQRRGPRGLRRVLTIFWTCAVLLPHLAWEAWSKRDDWEVQGQFGRGIYLLFIFVPWALRRRVVFSPHNSFQRSGAAWEDGVLQYATRMAAATIVYVSSEAFRFPAASKIELRVLWQYVPTTAGETRYDWYKKLSGARPVVLFAGQLRSDKNPLLLVDAVNKLGFSVNLVFAGQDKGAASEILGANLDGRHERFVESRYLDLAELVSLIKFSDVVVCPYRVASQSGVVALANQLGRPVIVSSAGGLGEQSPLTFDLGADQSEQLASRLSQVLAPESDFDSHP